MVTRSSYFYKGNEDQTWKETFLALTSSKSRISPDMDVKFYLRKK